jgi:hypothetical protein
VATDEDEQLAQAYGFKKSNGERTSQNFELNGKRYSARGFTIPATGQTKKFNQPYSVCVREELPIGGKVALAVLTPVTVAADGVLALLTVGGVIVLAPFAAIGIGGFFTMRAMDR